MFLAGALVMVILADIAYDLYSPITYRREVEDAIRDLRVSDPHVLVISSSHGRSFHVLGRTDRAGPRRARSCSIRRS